METTKVIFRVWRNGQGVIALFPHEPGTSDPWTCSSYEHIGQHGAASPALVESHTRLAKQHEYAELKHELEVIGYHLEVCKRFSRNAVDVRRKALSSLELKRLRSLTTIFKG